MSSEVADSAQFQVGLSSNDQYGRSFHMRDGEQLYFTRMDYTCPEGCLVAFERQVNLPYQWWWAGAFIFVPAGANKNTFYLASCPGYGTTIRYLSWPEDRNFDRPFRSSPSMEDAVEFRVRALSRDDHRSAPKTSEIHYSLPTFVSGKIEPSSYVAETLQLYNNASETNQLQASISFDVRNSYKFVYSNTFSSDVASGITVSIPFLSSIGLQKRVSYAQTSGTTSETEQTRFRTITGSIIANVDGQHTASISVVAHTAKVTIFWRANGSRNLLNKVGNPLLDQTGNVIPRQYFAASGILTTNDYYSYDSTVTDMGEIPDTSPQKCGAKNGKLSCDDGYCCGAENICGKGKKFCNVGCQEMYGMCHITSKIPYDCVGGERGFWTHNCLSALYEQSECEPGFSTFDGSQLDEWVDMPTAADIKSDMKNSCKATTAPPHEKNPRSPRILMYVLGVATGAFIFWAVPLAYNGFKNRRDGFLQLPGGAS
jgi:hypothetical protein